MPQASYKGKPLSHFLKRAYICRRYFPWRIMMMFEGVEYELKWDEESQVVTAFSANSSLGPLQTVWLDCYRQTNIDRMKLLIKRAGWNRLPVKSEEKRKIKDLLAPPPIKPLPWDK